MNADDGNRLTTEGADGAEKSDPQITQISQIRI
jgi:hypothetical protein